MKMAPRRAPSFFKVLIGDFSNQLPLKSILVEVCLRIA
ncbi:hypothetical protein CsSME_00005736 [Camellia sinensis var. sinensis]